MFKIGNETKINKLKVKKYTSYGDIALCNNLEK
jgi:hypothetical protein